MTGDEFEALFRTCMEETGDRYVTARDALLASDDTTEDGLRSRETSRDWREALVAGILLAWLRERTLHDDILSLMRDHPVHSRSPGPAAAPGRVAHMIAAMRPRARPDLVPAILEILTKTRETAPGPGPQILTGALIELRDRRAVQPLFHEVTERHSGDERLLAVGALGVLAHRDDPGVVPLNQRLLADRRELVSVRGSAAMALGRLGDPRAAEQLLRATRPDTAQPALRESAIRAMGYLWQSPEVAGHGVPAVGEAELADRLGAEEDDAVLLELTTALARLLLARVALRTPARGPADEALARAAAGHRNAAVRRVAKDWGRRITRGAARNGDGVT
ncbi:HEAT repeat domain-containing protein [Nonomuraea sp. C10]|uniref:HEAT repeat domain-containing protein n=1 Tax=Nonomuraea sp. C10 TaxID=2600577 RepID=UPI0011CECA34|nr:HEAT repeat domain-containing protein [Nonomuraea sp. C10]TXK43376.1 HEAT repeat domain-containing protein [Nonomuraea sp. C10]